MRRADQAHARGPTPQRRQQQRFSEARDVLRAVQARNTHLGRREAMTTLPRVKTCGIPVGKLAADLSKQHRTLET